MADQVDRGTEMEDGETIVKVFDLDQGSNTPRLPVVTSIIQGNSAASKVSSVTKFVAEFDIPSVATSLSLQRFIDRGRKHMRDHMAVLQPTDQSIPASDELMILANEANVVRAIDLHLLHPINRVLHPAQEDHFDILNIAENSISLKGMGEMKNGKDINPPEVRPDSCYMRVKKGQAPIPDRSGLPGGTNTRTFCVLEIKAEGLIPVEQLEQAFKPAGSPMEKGATGMLGDSAKGKGDSIFGNKGVKLIKQATGYAVGCRMRYVALFDYRTMVLLFYNTMSTKVGVEPVQLRRDLKEGNQNVEMAIIEMDKDYAIDLSDPNDPASKRTMSLKGAQIVRLVFLGFLLEGMEDTVADEGGP